MNEAQSNGAPTVATGGFLATAALVLVALALFPKVVESVAERSIGISRHFSSIAGDPLPEWLPKAIGVGVWLMAAFMTAYLLAEIKERSRRAYAVLVLLGSGLIAAYFATRVEGSASIEQLVGIAGASLGAIDGFSSLRRRDPA